MYLGHHFAGLIHEQIDGMTGMVPQQVVGPAARAAIGADILAPEEICLHIHLLNIQVTGDNPVVNILV